MSPLERIEVASPVPGVEEDLKALLRRAYGNQGAPPDVKALHVEELKGGRSGAFVFVVHEQRDGPTETRVAKMAKYSDIEHEQTVGARLRRDFANGACEPPEGALLLPEPWSLVPSTRGEAQNYQGYGLHLTQHAGAYGSLQTFTEFCETKLETVNGSDAIVEACGKLGETLRKCFYGQAHQCDSSTRAWYFAQRCPDIDLGVSWYDEANNLLCGRGASLDLFQDQARDFRVVCEEANEGQHLVGRHVGLGPLAVLRYRDGVQLGWRPQGVVGLCEETGTVTSDGGGRSFGEWLEQCNRNLADVRAIGMVRETRYSKLARALQFTNEGIGLGAKLDAKAGFLPVTLCAESEIRQQGRSPRGWR